MRRVEDLIRFWGWNTQGDFGPWTFYTDQRGGLVYYAKAPPLEPPSLLQTSVRNSIRLAAYTWRRLSTSRQEDWERAAKRAKLKIHGYNLFVFWILRKEDAAIHTIERISRIDLIPLEFANP